MGRGGGDQYLMSHTAPSDVNESRNETRPETSGIWVGGKEVPSSFNTPPRSKHDPKGSRKRTPKTGGGVVAGRKEGVGPVLTGGSVVVSEICDYLCRTSLQHTMQFATTDYHSSCAAQSFFPHLGFEKGPPRFFNNAPPCNIA